MCSAVGGLLNNIDYWLEKLRANLTEQRLSAWTIRGYVYDGRRFLTFLEQRGISLRKAKPADAAAFLDHLRRRYRRRVGHLPPADVRWRCEFTPAVHTLLRLAQGRWPPVSSTERHVEWFREKLMRDGFEREAIRKYTSAVRELFEFLEPQGVGPEMVSSENVVAFLWTMRRTYERRYGHQPPNVGNWQRQYLTGIRRFLALIQGQWPPPSIPDPELEAFRGHLNARGVSRKTIEAYCLHFRLFLDYARAQELDIAALSVGAVEPFFQSALRMHRSRKRKGPAGNAESFHSLNRRSIHCFLRFRLGQWPPDQTPELLKRFRAHLESLDYKPRVIAADVRGLRKFLAYLEENGIQADAIRKADIDAFVEVQLKRYRKWHRREPRDWFGWRTYFTGPIRSLLAMLNLRWPTAPSANTPWDCFTKRVCDGYGRWLTEVHGLSAGTLQKNIPVAAGLLAWLAQDPEPRSVEHLNTDDIDRFLAWRLPPLRRATRLGVCSSLRSFLRYLHWAKYIPRDLAAVVTQPSHYQFEDIPRSFTPEQVEGVLAATRKEHSPTGLRDYAILSLLATYGLRGGEVRRLKLDDIEWRSERLRIYQSKTGAESVLPLVEPVAEALLDYLQHGRLKTLEREVFLRAHAPHRPIMNSSSIATIVRTRFRKAGIPVDGRQGAHAFRLARAVSMMRASVSLKWIGDLLGHHNPDSTQTYIRLAMDDLRELSLELPGDKP